MIFSKQNLWVVDLTKNDKSIPALDNVHFTKEGLTIGTNGMAVIAVGPVHDNMLKHVIIRHSPLPQDLTISSETVKEVLKNIPRDTKYSGVTEHVDLSDKSFSLHTGKTGGEKKIGIKTYNREYANFQDVFKRAFSKPTEIKTAINLRRFISVLETLDKICPDSAQNSAAFIQFTKDNDLIIRCENPKTKQKAIAVMKSYSGVESRFPKLEDWERKLSGVRKLIKKMKRTVGSVVPSLLNTNLSLKEKSLQKETVRKEGVNKLKSKLRGRNRV